ncbi:MAG: EMC3/TMCO1 family protein [Candidatus Lutacidiplasmatales archaeon]
MPGADDEVDDSESSEGDEEGETSTPPARPAAPAMQFKFSTFLFTFLFVMGIYLVFDASARTAVALFIGQLLGPLIGFGGHFLLLTMFLAAAIEMLLTALAYNWTTDWVKAAKVQSWSGAFRKVQMAALKSGKKDRIAALQPHQAKLTQLSTDVSFAQLKGMAVTWFLVIAIYTWMGLFIVATRNAGQSVFITIGGANVSLLHGIGPVPLWFLLFSLYTVPLSLVFRRVLKHYTLQRLPTPTAPGSEPGSAGGSA